MYFLVEYDRAAGRRVDLRRYADADAATARADRLALDLARHRAGVAREIVMLHAASEAVLHVTHRRYFEDLDAMLRACAAALDAPPP